jgi:hypothetical protein
MQALPHTHPHTHTDKHTHHVASWGDLQDEAKVDVYQMALIGDEQVAVVAILGLRVKQTHTNTHTHTC